MKLPPDADTDTDGSSADVASSNQQDVDFSDYMWMGEEMEEFDSKELAEEAFIESCFEELFEEEDRFAEELELFLSSLTQEQVGSLVNQLDAVSISDTSNCSQQPASSLDVDENDAVSKLSPDAEVFVPSAEDQDSEAEADQSK